MTRAARGQSQLIDISCKIVQRRDKAIAIIDGTEEADPRGGKRLKWFWLPLSQIEIEGKDDDAIVTMPEWLATDKGLV